MNTLPRHHLIVASLLTCCSLGFGQSVAPAPSGPSAETEKDKEVAELSPFVVTDEAGSGYATTSSVTVSRIATKNTELPISAVSINEQMIADTMAVAAEDTFNLVSGLYLGNAGTGNQENNTFSLRGYTSSSAQRDGVDDSMFTSSGGFDYSFVDRIEVMKGPNGILYGSQDNPGGVINIVSKRPKARPFTKISVMSGSFNFYRAEIDTSQFFDKAHRWGFRIAGAVSDNDGPVKWEGDPNNGFRGINSSVSFRGKDGLEVWFYTAFNRDSSSRAKYITRAFATSTRVSASVPGATGAPLLDRNLIDGGGGQSNFTAYSEVDTDTYELGASKSLTFGGVRLDARLIGRYRDQFSDGSRVRGIGSDIFVDAAGNRIGVNNPTDNRFIDLSLVNNGQIAGVYRTGIRYDDRPGYKQDHNYGADLNFRFNVGPTRHQLLVTGTYTTGHSITNDNLWDITNVAKLQSLGYEVVANQPRLWLFPENKVPYNISRQTVIDNATTLTVRGGSINQNERYGYGAMERMWLFNDRVVLMGGARGNVVEQNNGRAGGTFTLNKKNKTTPGVAGLVKLYTGEKGEAIVYVNMNETYVPVFTTDTRLKTFGEKYPDRIASTKEYGIKLDLWKSKVVFTGSVFDNEESNVLLSFIDTDGTVTGTIDRTYSAPAGTRTTKGTELDLNFKIFGGLEAVIGWSRQKARLADTGQPPPAVPDGTASALVTYRWRSGWAKNLSASYIYSAWGESLLGGGRTNWLMPGGKMHSAVVGYRWKNMDIRLRVENLRDSLEVQPTQFDTALGVIRPRNYRLGVTYTF